MIQAFKCKKHNEIFETKAAYDTHRAHYSYRKCPQCDFKDSNVQKVEQHQASKGHSGATKIGHECDN